MSSKLSKSAKRVQDYLLKKGFLFDVKELDNSTRTAKQAAESIVCKVEQIAKSLIFRDKETGFPILVIASGTNRVSVKKIEASTGVRLDQADGNYVKKETGFAIGGVPPVGHSKTLKTIIDKDLKH